MNKSSLLLNKCVVSFIRNISTSTTLSGKRNFKKFLVLNKRGNRLFKEQQRNNPNPKIPIDKRGVKDTGFTVNGVYEEIPEKIPQIIVADLKDCQLKPYVSYRAPEVFQPEFTSKDLFDVVYAKKIIDDYSKNKLDEQGNPLEASEEEKLTPEEAWIKARKTGTDIF